MGDELNGRVARLEEQVAILTERLSVTRHALDAAHGEALFAAILTPVLVEVMRQNSLITDEVLREVLDRATLRMEESVSRFPDSKGALEYFLTRAELMLRSGRAAPPEPRSSKPHQ